MLYETARHGGILVETNQIRVGLGRSKIERHSKIGQKFETWTKMDNCFSRNMNKQNTWHILTCWLNEMGSGTPQSGESYLGFLLNWILVAKQNAVERLTYLYNFSYKLWMAPGLRMRNFTRNRFPIKNLLIDSLLTPIVALGNENFHLRKIQNAFLTTLLKVNWSRLFVTSKWI